MLLGGLLVLTDWLCLFVLRYQCTAGWVVLSVYCVLVIVLSSRAISITKTVGDHCLSISGESILYVVSWQILYTKEKDQKDMGLSDA
jgi:hypothetical protein